MIYYNEFYDMFKELHMKFEELSKRYANLKKDDAIVSSKCETILKENMNLKK